LDEMGAKILSPTPSLVLESDASNMGWEATNGMDRTGGEGGVGGPWKKQPII